MNIKYLLGAFLYFIVAALFAFATSQTNMYDYLISAINLIGGVFLIIASRRAFLKTKKS